LRPIGPGPLTGPGASSTDLYPAAIHPHLLLRGGNTARVQGKEGTLTPLGRRPGLPHPKALSCNALRMPHRGLPPTGGAPVAPILGAYPLLARILPYGGIPGQRFLGPPEWRIPWREARASSSTKLPKAVPGNPGRRRSPHALGRDSGARKTPLGQTKPRRTKPTPRPCQGPGRLSRGRLNPPILRSPLPTCPGEGPPDRPPASAIPFPGAPPNDPSSSGPQPRPLPWQSPPGDPGVDRCG
jgi:hypothetical protein